jgi:hypothetical protein
MVIQTILTAGQLAAAFTAIFAFAGLVITWGVVKPIKSYIDKMTYPIQPTANGGKSLPDLIDSVKRIERKIENIDRRVEKIELNSEK